MIELAIHPHNAVRRVGLVLFIPLFALVTLAILLALLGISWPGWRWSAS
jgi:hypothetical protein